ncbi:hypothetical protein LOTGIDRAFT_166723 [Lottia gigantea]|uniref:Fibrinogen C-terminal domain-containing protein n=1 Tax=Lottia gigantea TaxID=225164 RepID=V4BDY1_LOTGI|nr:hypothetical protein LOTGIDRAFT_166723 [Lottia gigantea]ESO86989.1 hypothetical protein LOTGIDRAFT_166723 [Lottia gigantea]
MQSFGCVADNCTCPWGYYGDKCTQIATDCRDYKEKGYTRLRRVLTTIHPVNSTRPFEVSCYLNLVGSMVIFERDSSCSMQNFNRSLHDYEIGFGNVPWNGWLGFDKIFQTSKPTMALHVILKYASGLSCEVKYRYFSIGNKSSQYTFHADRIQTNTIDFCGDSIMGGNGTLELTGRPFSTFDSDLTGVNCPAILGGGWWFANSSNCSDSFVTGSEMKDNFWRNLLQDQYISKVVFKISYY